MPCSPKLLTTSGIQTRCHLFDATTFNSPQAYTAMIYYHIAQTFILLILCTLPHAHDCHCNVTPQACTYFFFHYSCACMYLDNSGSDSRNLIGQLQVSKRGRNLERGSKCQWRGGGGGGGGGILCAQGI